MSIGRPGDVMDEVLCAMGGGEYTIKRLAAMTGRLENSIWKALRSLEGEGLVERRRFSGKITGGRRPHLYRIKQ